MLHNNFSLNKGTRVWENLAKIQEANYFPPPFNRMLTAKKKVKKKFLCSTPVTTMAMLIIIPVIWLRALPVVNNIALQHWGDCSRASLIIFGSIPEFLTIFYFIYFIFIFLFYFFLTAIFLLVIIVWQIENWGVLFL